MNNCCALSLRSLMPLPLLLVLLIACERPARAQPGSIRPKELETNVTVTLLLQPSVNASVEAQRWSRVFAGIGHNITARQGRNGERSGVTEVTSGKSRTVRAVGLLERNGEVVFGTRRFRQTDEDEIAEWLAVLKLYGAAGSPEGKPRWGLTEGELRALMESFSQPVRNPIDAESIPEAVEQFFAPEPSPLFFSDALLNRMPLINPVGRVRRDDLVDVSTGTALARLLIDYGLGFRPERQPDGSVVLLVEEGDEESQLWPVGWKPNEPLGELIPTIYRNAEVDLDEKPVDGITQLIANRLNLPWDASDLVLQRSKSTLAELKFSRPPSRMSPNKLMEVMENKLHLGYDIRTDEAGNLFLWVTTEGQAAAFKERFRETNR